LEPWKFLCKGDKKNQNEIPPFLTTDCCGKKQKLGIFGYLLFRTTKTPPIFNIARICQIANANLHDFAHAVRKESNFSLQMPTVVKATSPTSCDPPRVTMKLAKKLSSKYGGRSLISIDFVDWKVLGYLFSSSII